MVRKNVEKSIVVTEESLLNRLDNFYKLIYENCDEADLKDLMIITLTKISFCNHLLYGDNYDMFHFKAAIEMVNKKYDTKYTVNDFFIKL
ncbi:hypothetical protein H7K13_01320 [Priestia aryabhattai]|uniref:hypothetical protein n=1 Tax=Priestia aryabhattai TaxID=412384 RepID=UPI0013F60D77|nr:hypothetical protein [Priestia aryabhattai]MBY0073559.1 hypothetical protein [Priestia aryabhattai]NHH92687.1 hypothetical protein [Bacillus sp. MB95]